MEQKALAVIKLSYMYMTAYIIQLPS